MYGAPLVPKSGNFVQNWYKISLNLAMLVQNWYKITTQKKICIEFVQNWYNIMHALAKWSLKLTNKVCMEVNF